MIQRECGVLKTSYEADMALYPLPIARWAVAAAAVLFFAVIPLTLDSYYLSVANLVFDRHHRRPRSQHPGGLHGAGLDWPWGVHVRGRLHGGESRHPARLPVARQPARRRPHGGRGRRRGRHPVAPHQGPLSGHRDSRRPGHHRVDHQPRHLHQRRGPGVHRGAATADRPDGARRASAPCTTSCSSSWSSPSSARLNLVRSRMGRAFIAIRDQDIAAEIIGIDIFRYKLLAFAISSFYAGRDRRALHLLPRHRQLRAVPDRRVDRLPGHDHHRRARLRRWGRSSVPPS